MIAYFSIKSFSRVDTRFFKSSTVTEELSVQFETFGSDKPLIAFSSSSKFLSTDFVKSLIASNSFMKIFWKEVELCLVLCSVGLRGLLVVCGTSNDGSGIFGASRNIADVSSGDFCVSGMVKDVICALFCVSGTIMFMLSTWALITRMTCCWTIRLLTLIWIMVLVRNFTSDIQSFWFYNSLIRFMKTLASSFRNRSYIFWYLTFFRNLCIESSVADGISELLFVMIII